MSLTKPTNSGPNPSPMMLMFNIIGLGLGPLFVGFISDMLKPEYGVDSLRWGLMALMPFALAACAVQLAMMRHLEKDFAA